MNKAQELHREAMELAEQAALSRFRDDFAEARRLTRAAFEKEKAAALRIAGQLDFEPSRSVLLRSAASLAFECRELREAERLASQALSGEPPSEIAQELRDLLRRVYREWRLSPPAARRQIYQASEVREDAASYDPDPGPERARHEDS